MVRWKWLVPLLLIPAVAGGGFLWRRSGRILHPHATPPWTTVGTHRAAWENVLEGAKAQAKDGTWYDASYEQLAYPEGDVPPDRGACTDVVIRSLRHAGYDLQALIHEDMKKRFSEYPRRGDVPDSNIDHRRVPNQICFFKKYGTSLSLDPSSADWKPGDLVYWKTSRDHVGVISDTIGPSGLPMVIHNNGQCAEEDCLTQWPIVGHYRYPKS